MNDMKTEKYNITGMTCSACAARVEKCVGKLEGVESVQVNLMTNSMRVKYHVSEVNSHEIMDTVEKAGYGAYSENVAEEERKTGNCKEKGDTLVEKEMQGMKRRFIISLCFLLPLMYVSMHAMIAMHFPALVPKIVLRLFRGNENAIPFAFTQLLLLLPIMYLNRNYYEKGVKSLVHGAPTMDTLIAVGSGAAFLYGVAAIYQIGYGLGHGDMFLVETYCKNLYFESAGMIVTLITFGKYLESKSKRKTSAAIEKLMDLSPKQVIVERDGKEMKIDAAMLQVGDLMLLHPGESVAADGILIEGSGSMDESVITGESIPVEKKAGDRIISATINKTGFMKVKALKVGEETTISKMIRLVEEASQSKAPIARIADKISGIFVPTVMVIAVIAMGVWLLLGATFEFALSIGISVLVISCPCALGLATPVAIMAGIGKGAENGILIKSGEALEIAHKVDTIVLDKTGTITEGRPRVTDVLAMNEDTMQLIQIAASLEKGSEHPLAEAVLQYADERQIELLPMENFKAVFGKGISASLDGVTYLAGNERYMAENQILLNDKNEENGKTIRQCLIELAEDGKTPLMFAREHTLLGILAVADQEKNTSKLAIERFRKMGIHVIMLTGDHEVTARAFQKRLNIPEVIAQVLPEDKERHIRRLQETGHIVAMVGDGLNDAPALARADVGIAIGAGTDIAMESADAVLMQSDLLDVVSAIRLSKAVIRNIKENLFWAFFYNTLGIPVAAGVWYQTFGIRLSPMIGAAAMSLSSVCVVTNALRLRFFQTEKNGQRKQEKEKKKMIREIKIDGMMCEHCKKRVEDTLKSVRGVVTAEVNLQNKTATVTMDEEISTEILKQVITDAGYTFLESE